MGRLPAVVVNSAKAYSCRSGISEDVDNNVECSDYLVCSEVGPTSQHGRRVWQSARKTSDLLPVTAFSTASRRSLYGC